MVHAKDSECYNHFTVKWATLDWEKEQAYALRRRVFCREQTMFVGDDKDHIDDSAKVLVAIANHGGWHERIVGTVRIHEAEPNIWWGSRLAVEDAFRRDIGLGSELIRLAVSSAHALGCTLFLAQVQKQNEVLFQRLNWQSRYDIMVRNKLHVMMAADLEAYPPCYSPTSGFVLKTQRSHPINEIPSPLLHFYGNNHTAAKTHSTESQHVTH